MTMTASPTFEALLFDMDGTIVLTEEFWHETELRTMAHFGSEWTQEDRDGTIGGPFEPVVEYMAAKAQVDFEEVARYLRADIKELMSSDRLQVSPGAAELISQAHDRRIPLALVSNSWRELMDIVLATTGFEFDFTIAGDEVTANKPDPHPYLRACAALEVEPARAVVIEDSLTGVTSARAAGCPVVAVGDNPGLTADSRTWRVASLEQVTIDEIHAFTARTLVAG